CRTRACNHCQGAGYQHGVLWQDGYRRRGSLHTAQPSDFRRPDKNINSRYRYRSEGNHNAMSGHHTISNNSANGAIKKGNTPRYSTDKGISGAWARITKIFMPTCGLTRPNSTTSPKSHPHQPVPNPPPYNS